MSPAKLIDITGQRSGNLVVTERAGYNGNNVLWRCICDCGEEHVVRSANIRSGRVKSCGCSKVAWIREANSLPYGVAAFNELYASMKHSAYIRSYEWRLNKSQVKKLTSSDCFYCGSSPHREKTVPGGTYLYNGLDRVDNEEGYTIENVVPCCWVCNRAKLDMNVEEFVLWIKQVYRHVTEFGG